MTDIEEKSEKFFEQKLDEVSEDSEEFERSGIREVNAEIDSGLSSIIESFGVGNLENVFCSEIGRVELMFDANAYPETDTEQKVLDRLIPDLHVDDVDEVVFSNSMIVIRFD